MDACISTSTVAHQKPVIVHSSLQGEATPFILFAQQVTESRIQYTLINESDISIEMSNLRERAKSKGCEPVNM